MLRRCAFISSLVLFLACLHLNADPPDMSGHWQVDSAHSKFADEKTLALEIQQQGNQITLTRTYQDDNGKQASARFTCKADGKECDFDENGHKAKVSLWYNGPTLVVLKTNGEKHDSTVEWHMKLSKNGNTLTATREIMEPSDKSEKLVFAKSDSVASR
jgi:hypothetical protein